MPAQAAANAAPEKVTAAHIRRGLRKMFPHPECGIVFEVAQDTGFNAHRHLDAIAMDTWPSRGQIISGIEIKIDLYDWRREKADPAKAEQIARFCDKFFIAAPPGLIPVAELPHAWGLLEGGQNGMRVTKAAVKTKAQPADRGFLAAIFRASGRSHGADDVDLMVSARLADLEAKHSDSVKAEAERLTTSRNDDARHFRKLVQMLGIAGDDGLATIYGHDADTWLAVIKAVHASGIMDTWHGLSHLHKTCTDLSAKLAAAIETLNVPVPESERVKKPGKKKK